MRGHSSTTQSAIASSLRCLALRAGRWGEYPRSVSHRHIEAGWNVMPNFRRIKSTILRELQRSVRKPCSDGFGVSQVLTCCSCEDERNRGRPAVGLEARPASPAARWRAIHLATVTGWTPSDSATDAWVWPCSIRSTAFRLNAPKTEADPLLLILEIRAPRSKFVNSFS